MCFSHLISVLVFTWSDDGISFVLTNVTADSCWLFLEYDLASLDSQN